MIQVLLLVLAGLLSVIYLYYHYIYNYWIRKGIIQDSPVFLVGNFLDVVLNKKNAGWIYSELYSKFPKNDAVGFYEFNTPKLLVRNPELIEAIFIKDFSSFYDNEITVSLKNHPFLELDPFVMQGEKWKPARRSLINGLTKTKLKNMYELMNLTTPQLYDYIEEVKHEDINAGKLARLFMMTNISNSVYGINANCFKDENASIRKMVDLFSQDYWVKWWKVILIFYLQNLRDFLGVTFVPKEVPVFIEAMMKKVIETRMQNNVQRHDFLEYYLNQNKPLEEKIFELINHGMTFFIAGFETSSLPSANLLYELAMNPNAQENLCKELQAAYNGKDVVDYDTLISLPYLDQSFKEVLRKYPLMYGHMKLCTKTTYLTVDGKDLKIEKGTGVVIPAYAIHYDPQYFPNPEVFDPERFSQETMRSRHSCTWLPFGAGPRTCAGMKFGLLQAKLFVASTVLKYKIKLTDRTPSKLTMHKSAFFPSPNEAHWVRLEKRT